MTAWLPITRRTLKRIWDSGAVQFWDKNHLIAQIKQQQQQFRGNEPSRCENGGHLLDMAPTYPPGEKRGESAPVCLTEQKDPIFGTRGSSFGSEPSNLKLIAYQRRKWTLVPPFDRAITARVSEGMHC